MKLTVAANVVRTDTEIGNLEALDVVDVETFVEHTVAVLVQ